MSINITHREGSLTWLLQIDKTINTTNAAVSVIRDVLIERFGFRERGDWGENEGARYYTLNHCWVTGRRWTGGGGIVCVPFPFAPDTSKRDSWQLAGDWLPF